MPPPSRYCSRSCFVVSSHVLLRTFDVEDQVDVATVLRQHWNSITTDGRALKVTKCAVQLLTQDCTGKSTSRLASTHVSQCITPIVTSTKPCPYTLARHLRTLNRWDMSSHHLVIQHNTQYIPVQYYPRWLVKTCQNFML